MTNLELIKAHDESCKFCSIVNHMIDVSPTYKEIIRRGNHIVVDILKYLRDNDFAGMSIIMLLMNITKSSPYKPEDVNGFAAFDVKAAKRAWINWGKEKKLI